MKSKEFINTVESVVSPSRDTPLDQYAFYFIGSREPIMIAGNKYGNFEFCWHTTKFNTDYLGILDQDKLLGLMILSKERHNVPQIELTQTEAKYQRQGLQRYMLKKAAEKYGSIYSDDHQTAEARNFWGQLVKFPGGQFDISAVRLPDFVPVDIDVALAEENDLNILFVAANKNTVKTVKEQAIVDLGEQKRIANGRGPTWFGPGCNVE